MTPDELSRWEVINNMSGNTITVYPYRIATTISNVNSIVSNFPTIPTSVLTINWWSA